jgi:cephalosporin-C deacetylase-like acetyl esterase
MTFFTLVSSEMKVYLPPKPAPLPADFDEFFATLTEKEKELHQLATEKLGSSYFIQWTHMYLEWSKAKAKANAST